MVTLILKDTYLKLQEEIKSLAKLRTETAAKIQEAASHGDLKENYEYKAAREAMGLLVSKKESLDSYEPFRVIEYKDIESDAVGFGNKITVLEEGKKDAENYYLLGPIESELEVYPLVVTYHTPFAKAMMGKEVNEDFILEIEGKEVKFIITAIEKITEDTPQSTRKPIL
tara:strand:- start:416 stop:925 length:510 start_codon:yes stop_codon:yes gene_type:complete